MLKVLPIQTKEEQKKFAELCGIEYKPDLLAYAASVDEDFVGMCQFRTNEGSGEVYDLVLAPGKTDFEALFVMGRATLNFIDLCGVHHATYCSEKVDKVLLEAIGFVLTPEGKYEVDLTDFFNHPCRHHKTCIEYDTPQT